MSRPRLHTSSLVAGLVALLLMTVIVGPGVDSERFENRTQFPIFPITGFYTEDVDHGWPAVFLDRRVDYSFYYYPEGRPKDLDFVGNYPSEPH